MKKTGILNKAVVAINLQPRFDSELADEGLYGMIVDILEDFGDNWYYIRTNYNYMGYIHGSNMIIDNETAEGWKNNAKDIITHGIVDIMDRPNYQGIIRKTLTRGATIWTMGNMEGEWGEVSLADGTRGWIRRDFIDNKNKGISIREKLVKTAMSYLGTQYRWGGKSPLGIDCSGLCSISYLLNGIIIYRDAIRKDEYMRSITLEEIDIGDLIFFPNHVAMYIGNNKYIHSSAKLNGVHISSLNPEDDDYWQELANTITDIGTALK